MMTRRTAAMAAASYARVLGANDRLRAALVGCGTRGVEALLTAALGEGGVEFAAACDVFKPNLDRALSKIGGSAARGYGDYREVVDRKDIDIVFVATPDHWHAPITVAACAAGKDVYVEKPLANSIADCLLVMDAEARHKRIVQVGVQQRSMPIYFDALERIKAGRIGPLLRCAMVWNAEGRGRRPAEAAVAPPDGLDWEAFQGPAPRRPYVTSRQRSWRSWWEYGSGAITDFGVHLLDVMHWFAGIDSPDAAFGAGYHSPARLPEQIPDVVHLTWKYKSFLGTYSSCREEWGNTFYGEQGKLHVNRSVLRVTMFEGSGAPEEIKMRNDGEMRHVRNFLECVRTRRRPNADAVTGGTSTIACLLAALAVRTGRAHRFDVAARQGVAV